MPFGMSDVIWAAIIAVAGSGFAGGIAAWASTAVARGQQGLELARYAAGQELYDLEAAVDEGRAGTELVEIAKRIEDLEALGGSGS